MYSSNSLNPVQGDMCQHSIKQCLKDHTVHNVSISLSNPDPPVNDLTYASCPFSPTLLTTKCVYTEPGTATKPGIHSDIIQASATSPTQCKSCSQPSSNSLQCDCQCLHYSEIQPSVSLQNQLSQPAEYTPHQVQGCFAQPQLEHSGMNCSNHMLQSAHFCHLNHSYTKKRDSVNDLAPDDSLLKSHHLIEPIKQPYNNDKCSTASIADIHLPNKRLIYDAQCSHVPKSVLSVNNQSVLNNSTHPCYIHPTCQSEHAEHYHRCQQHTHQWSLQFKENMQNSPLSKYYNNELADKNNSINDLNINVDKHPNEHVSPVLHSHLNHMATHPPLLESSVREKLSYGSEEIQTPTAHISSYNRQESIASSMEDHDNFYMRKKNVSGHNLSKLNSDEENLLVFIMKHCGFNTQKEILNKKLEYDQLYCTFKKLNNKIKNFGLKKKVLEESYHSQLDTVRNKTKKNLKNNETNNSIINNQKPNIKDNHITSIHYPHPNTDKIKGTHCGNCYVPPPRGQMNISLNTCVSSPQHCNYYTDNNAIRHQEFFKNIQHMTDNFKLQFKTHQSCPQISSHCLLPCKQCVHNNKNGMFSYSIANMHRQKNTPGFF